MMALPRLPRRRRPVPKTAGETRHKHDRLAQRTAIRAEADLAVRPGEADPKRLPKAALVDRNSAIPSGHFIITVGFQSH